MMMTMWKEQERLLSGESNRPKRKNSKDLFGFCVMDEFDEIVHDGDYRVIDFVLRMTLDRLGSVGR